MKDPKQNNLDLPATKADLGDLEKRITADLATMRGDFEQLFASKSEMEQLLADQANVILEAVDEKLDTKLDAKFGTVITKLDAVMKEVQAHREEDVAGAEQLRRHDDKLKDYERRIKTLELHPQQSV
jgi:hypothetical protein